MKRAMKDRVSCILKRKTRYNTEAKARSMAHKKSADAGIPLFVYECSNCGHWHLTKKGKGKK